MKDRAAAPSRLARWGTAWERFWFGEVATGGSPKLTQGPALLESPELSRRLTRVRLVVTLAGLVWLLVMTPLITSWLAGDGWLSIPAMRSWLQNDPTFSRGLYLSFWNWIDAPAAVWGVHVASFFVLACFALGCGGRLMAVLAWWVVISYVQRTGVLNAAFEHVLASFSLYLVLAPGLPVVFPGRVWGDVQPVWLQHVVVRLMSVHLSLLYGVMGLSKLASGVWWNGEGAWWILSQAESPLVDWTFLRSLGLVVDFWTHAIVVVELGMALLMWHPDWRAPLRWLGLLHWTLLAMITGDFTLAGLMAGLTWMLVR